ncbi:SpaH/EbpB family LPXTG-anchored major pilin [Gardnerella sp. KA00288]|uniref:SpaH/EbpB family LPXTG-anchored major pilin n=1 Tax=Gardnerella sp. KA00288 TaxID=2749074 RepID=UPI003BAB6479
MNKFTKQCVAAVASLAMAGTLCVAGAVVAGSSAWATPSVVGGTDTTLGKGTTGVDNPSKDSAQDYGKAPWNLGDQAATKTGSITIYKWKSETGEGNKQKKETPVKGAGFTIKKVKSIGSTTLDLTKYSDWSEIAKNVKQLNNGEINATGADSKLKVEFDTLTLNGDTNANGVVQFKDLPLGLYQVQETKVPAGYSASDGGKAFYMTLPMIEKVTTGQTTETKYNYAPFVDPKNTDQSGIVTKSQDLTHTVGAGDTIEYTIKAKLDKSKADTKSENVNPDELKGYTIFDLAPSDYFTAYDHKVITEMTVGDTENQGTVTKGTPLEYKDDAAQSDYTVDNSTTIPAVTEQGKEDVARTKIKIEFTDSGRKKLAAKVNDASNVGKTVYVTVHFKFTLADSTKLKTGKVTNKASVIPSHVPGSSASEIPADTPPSTDFATFKIKKVSSQDENTALGGAKFRLFAVKTEAQACTDAIKAGTNGTELDKVCKNKSSVGFDEKTTADKTENGKTLGETDGYSVKRGTEFYVVETAAPAGYIRNPDVQNVTVETGETTKTITVKNIPDSGNGGKGWLFNLPKTGAAGVVIFALAGVCLVCFGIFVFMRNRKKDEEQQAA